MPVCGTLPFFLKHEFFFAFIFLRHLNVFFTRILLRRIRPAPNGCERVMHRLLNSAESEFNGFCAFFFIFFPMLLRRLVTCFCKPQHRNIEHDQNRYGKKSRLYHECGPKIKKREKRSIHAVADISASQFSSVGIAKHQIKHAECGCKKNKTPDECRGIEPFLERIEKRKSDE